MYGLNVQACCDAYSRFTYASILYPGSTNDYLAFTECPLYDYMRTKCPRGFYLVPDNGYGLEDKFLVPFCGTQLHGPARDSYNFCLSQLRIISSFQKPPEGRHNRALEGRKSPV